MTSYKQCIDSLPPKSKAWQISEVLQHYDEIGYAYLPKSNHTEPKYFTFKKIYNAALKPIFQNMSPKQKVDLKTSLETMVHQKLIPKNIPERFVNEEVFFPYKHNAKFQYKWPWLAICIEYLIQLYWQPSTEEPEPFQFPYSHKKTRIPYEQQKRSTAIRKWLRAMSLMATFDMRTYINIVEQAEEITINPLDLSQQFKHFPHIIARVKQYFQTQDNLDNQQSENYEQKTENYENAQEMSRANTPKPENLANLQQNPNEVQVHQTREQNTVGMSRPPTLIR